jgi:hypothetical protein
MARFTSGFDPELGLAALWFNGRLCFGVLDAQQCRWSWA